MPLNQSLHTIVSNITFALQVLLLFLFLVESNVEIPTWLQPVGRMHPLLLHLPIGALTILAAFQLLRQEFDEEARNKIQHFILYVTVLTACLSALMGLFLSREQGYDPDVIRWHKWTGIILNYMCYALLLLHEYWRNKEVIFRVLLWVNVVVMILTGHLGAELTHGANFIFSPLQDEAPAITAETPIYVALIHPILKRKCFSCHNKRKAKGQLIMTSRQQLLMGGEHGQIWKSGNADSSHIIQHLKLPIDDKKHMPPKGKIQASESEIRLIATWITSGADFEKRLVDYENEDSIYSQFSNGIAALQITDPVAYTFDFAPTEAINRLNTPFRSVRQLAVGTPGVEANIFVRETYEPTFLTELLEVQEQLVSLNLTNLPIQDGDMKTIGRFRNLEKLRLNGTDIIGATLSDLASCTNLRTLALANTKVTKGIGKALKSMPSLREIYIWNTKISLPELEKLEEELPNIYFNGGFIPEQGERLKLSPPILVNKKLVLSAGEAVRLKSVFSGLTIRYTIDGSEPDSLTSKIYDQPLRMGDQLYVRAKAYKDGWQSSDVADFMLFKRGQRASRASLLQPSNRQFAGTGADGLIDLEKGNARELFSPYWLGYNESFLEAYIYFDEPKEINQILISYCLNVESSRLPPVSVEIWGGMEESNLQRLASSRPPLPAEKQMDRVDFLPIKIPPSSFLCYKIVARPNGNLPLWHKQKGKKGFLMVDEILFY